MGHRQPGCWSRRSATGISWCAVPKRRGSGRPRRQQNRMPIATWPSARQEMEEELRRTRMESDKVLARAKAESETLVENARREAEAAQERARVLEERRGELMAELETAQAAISQFESELEAKRASLSTAGTDPSTSVRVIPTEEPDRGRVLR